MYVFINKVRIIKLGGNARKVDRVHLLHYYCTYTLYIKEDVKLL